METPLKPLSTTIELSEAMSFDDIIFMNRHRAYGAYDLRKAYPVTLRNAVLIGVGIFLMMFILPTVYNQLKPEEAEMFKRTIELENVHLDPPPQEKPIPLPEKPIEAPKQTTVKSLMPEVKQDQKVQEEELPPPVSEFEHAAPGQETVEGTGDEITEIVAPPENIPDTKTQPAEVKAEEPIWTGPIEVQPEFVGGLEGLRNFLIKNLKYPPMAQRSNIQGKVFMSFTVEPDGSLSNITVERGIGFGCDEEASRVLKLMPKWKPGKQSGRAVRVKFNMPIVFALQD